jgi:hypothetical protein
MKKSWIIGAALLALTVCGANAQTPAQTRKARKEAAVVNDKAAVAADKANLEVLRDQKADDKILGYKSAVRADRKAIRKADQRLMKDRAKRDVDKVKKVL